MALRMMTTEQATASAPCPRCGAATGEPCDPATLSALAVNHAERMKAARRAAYLRSESGRGISRRR